MKQQTFISIERDASGSQRDFERWNCKRAATIQKRYARIYKDSCMFQMLMRKQQIEKIDVYRTPDGYTKEADPCYSFNLSDITDGA